MGLRDRAGGAVEAGAAPAGRRLGGPGRRRGRAAAGGCWREAAAKARAGRRPGSRCRAASRAPTLARPGSARAAPVPPLALKGLGFAHKTEAGRGAAGPAARWRGRRRCRARAATWPRRW